MSLFTLFPNLRSQSISRTLRESPALWSTLERIDEIGDDFIQGYRKAWIEADESKDAYAFTVELPGFKKDQVSIEIQDDVYLVVTATGSHAKQKISRNIALPADAEASKIEAKLEDGLLTVVIQKAVKPTPRKVVVN